MFIRIVAVCICVTFLLGCSRSEDPSRLVSIDNKLIAGQHDVVIRECRQYLKEYPESYRGWNTLGWAHLRKDELDEAEKCLNRSIEINAGSDNAYVGKGVLCRKKGDTKKARENYLKAIALAPESPEAYSSISVIELMEGNDNEAVKYGEKAWVLDKSNPTIAANLSVAYHYLGNHQQRDKYYGFAEQLGYPKTATLQAIFRGEKNLR